MDLLRILTIVSGVLVSIWVRHHSYQPHWGQPFLLGTVCGLVGAWSTTVLACIIAVQNESLERVRDKFTLDILTYALILIWRDFCFLIFYIGFLSAALLGFAEIEGVFRLTDESYLQFGYGMAQGFVSAILTLSFLYLVRFAALAYWPLSRGWRISLPAMPRFL